MVWARIGKIRLIRRQESDGDGGVGKKKERKFQSGGRLDSIRNDLSERELSGEDAQDRVKWRSLIRHIYSTQSGKRCGRRRRLMYSNSLRLTACDS